MFIDSGLLLGATLYSLTKLFQLPVCPLLPLKIQNVPSKGNHIIRPINTYDKSKALFLTTFFNFLFFPS